MSAPSPAPAERLTLIIDLLCRATAARIAGGMLAGPVILLIWSYLRRLGARFVRLAARIEAGRDRPRRHAAAHRPAPPPRRPHPLPRGRGWLLRLVPQAAAGASQLQHLLTEPEMAALIAASPHTGRLLRPLCRMLGVRPPPALLPPPRRRERVPRCRTPFSFLISNVSAAPPPAAAGHGGVPALPLRSPFGEHIMNKSLIGCLRPVAAGFPA